MTNIDEFVAFKEVFLHIFVLFCQQFYLLHFFPYLFLILTLLLLSQCHLVVMCKSMTRALNMMLM